MHPNRPPRRGLALIEALVAMTVTAVGLVSVLGVQVVLRQNADLAKQRSEAVRLAQEEIERWRAFATVDGTPPAGQLSYQALASGTNPLVNGSNTDFTVSRVVNTSTEPVLKTLAVTVAWQDRNGADQSVRLNTTINGVAPELAATVVVAPDGTPVARPGGRIQGAPKDAKRLSATESGFRPPQEGVVGLAQVWKINNTTGIVTICSTTAPDNESLNLSNISNCLPGRAQLLSGFVRFARPLVSPALPRQPLASDAEFPVSTPLAVQVKVLRTLPSAVEVNCFGSTRSTFIAYYCAVPVATEVSEFPLWSGRVVVTGLSALTDEATQMDPARQKVCRYTRYNDDRTVQSGTIKNEEHPLDYFQVGGPLANQNFLLIHAGDGSTAFNCPADDPLTPLNTTTRLHPLTLTSP